MPTTFSAALAVLQTHLATALAADTDFQLSTYDAAPFLDVVTLSSEPDPAMRAGKPHILLSGTDEAAPEWGFTARRATILASCRASEFAGALVGTSNTEAMPEKIARKLQVLIETDYAALRDAGLLNNQSSRGRNGTLAANEGEGVHFVDVQITFVYLPN